MRSVDVLSTSTKRLAIDQDGDELKLYVAVPGACIILELELEQGAELAAALERLVEDRRCEVAGVIRTIAAVAGP